MPKEKKLTQEDTWTPADLTKHMRDAGHGEEHGRRREERERRARDNKEEERESRRARDKNKEEERERRRARDNKDEERESRRARDPRDERHVERKREGGGEREKERRREWDGDTRGPNRDPQKDREGERQRHKDRAREKESGDEREKRREERERHRRREGGREREGERDGEERERRDEREKRREERERDRRREGGRERQGEHDGEERERRKEREHQKEGDRRQDERGERHGARKRLEEEKEKENNEERTRDRERRREKEERERRREKEERRQEKEERGGRDEGRERRQKQNQDDGESMERREPEANETRHHGDRDMERERRRAGRHPVPPEPEPPEPGPEVPPARRTSERKAAAEPEQTSGEIAYEDDFEEYEEDFEELDESGGEEDEEEQEEKVEESPRQEMGRERSKEVEAIQRAMEEENRRAGTAQSSRRSSRTQIRPQESEQNHQGSPHRGSHRSPQRGKFIDFVAAKQREISQKVSSQQKKRSVELLRLVDLDFSPTSSLLDLPPLSEYDVYIKNFGNTNTKQAYVQCREDDGEQDVQTDLIQVLDKWTQHPADHTRACGDPGRSQDAPDGNTAQINIDSQRLATFLHSAAQVMSVLLEEDHAERQSLRTTRTQTDALSFSEGNLQLNTQLSFLIGRTCSLLLFSSVQRQTLLSVHGPLDRPGAIRLDGWTLVCIWNIWEPSRPQKILVYESEVRCCCFSPGRSALVLAGTSDGSLVLWDLREPDAGHYSMTISETEWIFRQPTFSTDAVLSTLGHLSAVHSIEVLPSSTSSSSSAAADPQPPLLASEESAGMSFQLASLDERGVLNLWVVLELPAASLAGSQTDLGLRPGGKVKLLHSSCLPAVERGGADIEALQLHFLPNDANHFLLTTNMGVVHHGTAHGFRSPPRFYRSQEVETRPVHVTSVHFSPFNPQLFLVGCADGSMRLHVVSSHWPLAEWTTCRGGGASEVGVVSARWSQSRPAVFCVLDSASHLHLWDLSRDPLRPVVTEMLHADGVTAMAVFGSSSSLQRSYSGVALAHHSGRLQLHYFNPTFSSANHTEEDILQSMMHQAS